MPTAPKSAAEILDGVEIVNLCAPTNREPGYSRREVHFMWAHIEEYIELNEANSNESGRKIRDALKHEWDTLPEGIICSCGPEQETAESIGGSPRPSGRTPNLALADMRRAYQALPIGSVARTILYLMLVPTHSASIKHLPGQKCDRNWFGDHELTHETGHQVRHSETQVFEMSQPEFQARHRRRVAIETAAQMGRPARVQDSWPEPRDAFAYMADYLNLGEAAFLERGPKRSNVIAALAMLGAMAS